MQVQSIQGCIFCTSKKKKNDIKYFQILYIYWITFSASEWIISIYCNQYILQIPFRTMVPSIWTSFSDFQVEVYPKKCLSSISCCQQAPSSTIPTCPLVSVSTVDDLAGRKRFTARPPGLFTDNCSRANTEGVGQQHLRVCLPDENLYLTFHNMLLFHTKFILCQANLLYRQKKCSQILFECRIQQPIALSDV